MVIAIKPEQRIKKDAINYQKKLVKNLFLLYKDRDRERSFRFIAIIAFMLTSQEVLLPFLLMD